MLDFWLLYAWEFSNAKIVPGVDFSIAVYVLYEAWTFELHVYKVCIVFKSMFNAFLEDEFISFESKDNSLGTEWEEHSLKIVLLYLVLYSSFILKKKHFIGDVEYLH